MSDLVYQSEHTGTKIDEAVSKVPTLEQQINDLDTELEKNSMQVMRVVRDLQLTGTQTLVFQREVKGLYCFGNINSTTRITFGATDKYGNMGAFTQSLQDNSFYGFNNHSFIIYSATNKATRFVVNFRGNEIDLIWSFGGDSIGAEGNVGLNIIAFFQEVH